MLFGFLLFLFTIQPMFGENQNEPLPYSKFNLAQADSSYDIEENSDINLEFLPEIKISAFLPIDQTYQTIYSVAPLYTLEATVLFYKGLASFLNVGFLYNSGHLITTSSNRPFTELYMVPIGFGLKYYFPLRHMEPYLGIGMLVNYAYTSNNSSNISSSDDWTIGGLFKLGTIVDITSIVFLDFFIDYYYLTPNFHSTSPFVISTTANISGFSLGAGLGGYF